MEIFLDSSDISEIEKATRLNTIDGITTNPSLMAKTIKANPKLNYNNFIAEIAKTVTGPVSIEVIAENYDGMIEEGKKILSIADNIVLKLPTTLDGLRACTYFSAKNHKVNMTLCFSVNQAILVAKAGATYVSPFVGRLDDIGTNGTELISDIREVFDNYEFDTKILAASLRHPQHISDMAIIGADVVTIPPKLLYQMLNHPMTDKGLAQFKSDWEAANK